MADSTIVLGTPCNPAPVGAAADATSPEGNGHSEVVADSPTVTLSLADPTALLRYTGNGDSALTTGYIQSATAGRGVISITTNQAFTYTGTGSTLVAQASATGADTLFIAARSVTMTTGTLTALGAGSTALDVTANGGAGSGGIDVTVNGDILSSAGRGIILDQNDLAATGNVLLTSTAGSTITAGAGIAVTILTSGSGTITVDLADSVAASGGDGIVVRDSVTGGDISISTAAVSALSAGGDALDIRSASTTADVTIVSDGALSASDEAIIAAILDSTATGNITVTTNGSVTAGNNGIEAVNSGTGATTVHANGTLTASGGDGILAASSGGAITVTAGNVLTANAEQGIDLQQTNAAGAGALSVTASGDVSGTDAIRALNSGTGAVTVLASGSLTGTNGNGVLVVSTNAAAGAIGVTTSVGETLSASNGSGINIDQAGTGNVGITNAAAINSGPVANRLQSGIDVVATGTGNVTVNNSGAIGTAGDRAQQAGILAAIVNAASAGTLSVGGSGAIFSAQNGIDVFTNGTGAASVVYGGAVNATGGDGIQVDTTSGAITVTSGGAIDASAGNGIRSTSTTGNQAITVNAAVSGGAFDGVRAASTSGTVNVSINGGNVTGADDAVHVSSDGAKAITVAAGRTLSGGDLGIASTGTGSTTITNGGTITGSGVAIRSETSATTLNNLAGGTINGAVFLSDLNDVVNNAGTIAGALNLGAGNDLYDGRTGSISGIISGNAGNDTFMGGAANDRFNGGDGMDTVTYAGLFRSFDVALSGASGTVAGASVGSDTLTSIEVIEFLDGKFVFDANGVAAQVTRLYDTALQRGPDQLGLDYYVDRLEDQGGTLKQVAADLLFSAEFQALTGNLSNADYVEFLYQNALHRSSDPEGKSYWVGQLESGARDRADLLIGFSESQEHRTLTAGLVDQGFFNTDDDYQAVALLYDTFAGRQPDAGGLIYWAEAIEGGTFTLDEVADRFADSVEFRNLTAGMSNSQLVDFMYENSLDRPSDPEGLNYWTGRLNAGMDRGDLLIGFAYSLEHVNLLGGQITYGIDFL